MQSGELQHLTPTVQLNEFVPDEPLSDDESQIEMEIQLATKNYELACQQCHYLRLQLDHLLFAECLEHERFANSVLKKNIEKLQSYIKEERKQKEELIEEYKAKLEKIENEKNQIKENRVTIGVQVSPSRNNDKRIIKDKQASPPKKTLQRIDSPVSQQPNQENDEEIHQDSIEMARNDNHVNTTNVSFVKPSSPLEKDEKENVNPKKKQKNKNIKKGKKRKLLSKIDLSSASNLNEEYTNKKQKTSVPPSPFLSSQFQTQKAKKYLSMRNMLSLGFFKPPSLKPK